MKQSLLVIAVSQGEEHSVQLEVGAHVTTEAQVIELALIEFENQGVGIDLDTISIYQN